MLRLYIWNSLLSQHSVYALLRFRHKTHLVRVRSASGSGFKYLFWWQWSQMEIIHLPSKNSWFWSPEKRLEMSADLFKNHLFLLPHKRPKLSLFLKICIGVTRAAVGRLAALLACSDATIASSSSSPWYESHLYECDMSQMLALDVSVVFRNVNCLHYILGCHITTPL